MDSGVAPAQRFHSAGLHPAHLALASSSFFSVKRGTQVQVPFTRRGSWWDHHLDDLELSVARGEAKVDVIALGIRFPHGVEIGAREPSVPEALHAVARVVDVPQTLDAHEGDRLELELQLFTCLVVDEGEDQQSTWTDYRVVVRARRDMSDRPLQVGLTSRKLLA